MLFGSLGVQIVMGEVERERYELRFDSRWVWECYVMSLGFNGKWGIWRWKKASYFGSKILILILILEDEKEGNASKQDGMICMVWGYN